MRKFAFLVGFLGLTACGNTYLMPHPSDFHKTDILLDVLYYWEAAYDEYPNELDMLWIKLHGETYTVWRQKFLLTFHDIAMD